MLMVIGKKALMHYHKALDRISKKHKHTKNQEILYRLFFLTKSLPFNNSSERKDIKGEKDNHPSTLLVL